MYTDSEIKPYSPCAVVDHGHPCAQGLVGYWPFTEHGGRQWRNAITEKTPIYNGAYPGRWTMTPAGMAMDVLQTDSNGQIIKLDNVLGGRDRATIGFLIYVQVKDSVSATGGVVCGASGGAYAAVMCCSDGNIDNHCRVDFIANTAYARPNIGQLNAGSIYTIFASWVSGTAPRVFKGLYPGGIFTEFTYSDRGTASGTIGTSTNAVIGLDGNNRAALRLLWLGMWGRALPQHEMVLLHQDPWGMLQDDIGPWAVTAAAAGGWASRTVHGGPPGARVVC